MDTKRSSFAHANRAAAGRPRFIFLACDNDDATGPNDRPGARASILFRQSARLAHCLSRGQTPDL